MLLLYRAGRNRNCPIATNIGQWPEREKDRGVDGAVKDKLMSLYKIKRMNAITTTVRRILYGCTDDMFVHNRSSGYRGEMLSDLSVIFGQSKE